jgi:hypothetical protein
MPCKDLSALDGYIPGDAGWRSVYKSMSINPDYE